MLLDVRFDSSFGLELLFLLGQSSFLDLVLVDSGLSSHFVDLHEHSFALLLLLPLSRLVIVLVSWLIFLFKEHPHPFFSELFELEIVFPENERVLDVLHNKFGAQVLVIAEDLLNLVSNVDPEASGVLPGLNDPEVEQPVVLVVFVPVAAAFVGVPEWVRVSVALPAVGDGPAVLFIGVLDPLNFVPDVGRPVV